MEVVDEQINLVGRAFLGLTLSCARCHDHKFDPIPTRDYYALAGIFRSTRSLLPGNVSRFVTTRLPLPPKVQKELDSYQAQKKHLQDQLEKTKKVIDRLDKGSVSFDASDLGSFAGVIQDEEQALMKGNWTSSTFTKPFVARGYHHSPNAGDTVTYSLSVSRNGKYRLRAAYTASANRTDSARYEITQARFRKVVLVDQRKPPPIENHFVSLAELNLKVGQKVQVVLRVGNNGTTIADAVQLLPLEKEVSPAGEDPLKAKRKQQLKLQRKKLDELNAALVKLNRKAPAKASLVMSVQEQDQPQDYHVCIRGDVHSLGEKVRRGALQVVGETGVFGELSGSGRRELADWLTRRGNPLTARVYANRVWQWVFGRAIVRSPDNFGLMGQRPTHPELLDLLAFELVRNGWSTKKLHLNKRYRVRHHLLKCCF